MFSNLGIEIPYTWGLRDFIARKNCRMTVKGPLFRSNFGIVALNNHIYVAGGYIQPSICHHTERYDIRANKWEKLQREIYRSILNDDKNR